MPWWCIFFSCQHAEISMNMAVQSKIWALTWHPRKRDVFWFPCRLWGVLCLQLPFCSLQELTNGVVSPLYHTAVHTLMLDAVCSSEAKLPGACGCCELCRASLALSWLHLSEPCPAGSSHRCQGCLSHRFLFSCACLIWWALTSQGSLTSFV